jgi:predicted acetyltransferase
MHDERLVEISDRDKEDRNIYGMLQDIGREENGFGNEAYGLSFDQYRQFIEEKIRDKDEKTVRSGFAPQTIFWLYDGDEAVGLSTMRHHLHDRYRVNCGHIGFAIRKNARGKGYGKSILRLTIAEIRKIGVKDISLICKPSNTASRKIIESNGGVLEREDGGHCFYWVHL